MRTEHLLLRDGRKRFVTIQKSDRWSRANRDGHDFACYNQHIVVRNHLHGFHTLYGEYGAVNQKFGSHNQMSVSGNQIKAARALIGMEQAELAEKSNVSVNTIRNMEAANSTEVRVRSDTLFRVQDALRSAGVIFIDENGDGPGVRLRKTPKPRDE
jgi:hypothetical protein